MPRSNTGWSLLPDPGRLAYNGIVFSALYVSKITGTVVQDDAKRTTKYVEYLIEVEGLVTLNPGEDNTDASWLQLRRQLTVHGGVLVYRGKGFSDLTVNLLGSPIRDVAFGPVPTILAFQTLGQNRSSFIKWQVITRVAEVTLPLFSPIKTAGAHPLIVPVLQYNYEAEISYGEDGYSALSLRGVLEIPMTRQNVDERTLTNIVDAYRSSWLDIKFDLTKFRIVKRDFTVSRDKRRIDWIYSVEELPPMDLPPGSTIARGSFNVRPVMHVPPFGIISDKLWYATLRCTYTIRPDFPRETALYAFYAMWSFRMRQSVHGNVPGLNQQGNSLQQQQASQNNVTLLDAAAAQAYFIFPPAAPLVLGYAYNRIFQQKPEPPPEEFKTAWVTDFTIDEGLYLDSKSITFSAAWMLTCTFATLLNATGIWHRPPDVGATTWATSIQDVMGWRSWLTNRLDPTADVIVDMGGGQPPFLPSGPIAP